MRGDPDAVLIVEFAERRPGRESAAPEAARRADGRSRLRLDQPRRKWGGVVEITSPRLQSGIAELRAAGLNVMMSMKRRRQAGLVRRGLRGAAAASRRLHRAAQRASSTKHGTRGTMYAHASEGCLHVRPVLNLKLRKGRQGRCAPSPRKPSRWCANTRARIPASMATAWCARNFTRRCSARASSRDFERSSTRFDPDKAAQPRQDRRPAARWTIARCFAIAPDYRVARPRDRRSTGRPIPARRRLPGRGRDVQQQRRLPQARGRRDVPVVSRHPRREARRRAAAPIRCGWRSPASSARTR